jgi:5-methylcytosine-specific restriction endonuclease McrA
LTPQDLLSDLPYLDKHQFVDKLIEQTPVSLTAQCSTSFMPALVLNADYQPLSFTPLSLWSWQEAVKAVFRGKVTVVDVYENAVIRGVSLEIPLPSVIALNEYVSNHKSIPAFTKRNVYLRDEYRCQYCNGEFFSQNDLSIDHVHPRCKGGRLNWENAVVRATLELCSAVSSCEHVPAGKMLAVRAVTHCRGNSCAFRALPMRLVLSELVLFPSRHVAEYVTGGREASG